MRVMCNLQVALTCGGGFLSALSEISFTLMRPVLSAGKRTRVRYAQHPQGLCGPPRREQHRNVAWAFSLALHLVLTTPTRREMPEGNVRLVHALYWFVDDELEPLALNLGDAKFFCFFSTRWNANAFKHGQAMPPGQWTMLSTESADHLVEVCERATGEGYTDFALNPPPNYDGRDRRWGLDEFKDIIERPAGGERYR